MVDKPDNKFLLSPSENKLSKLFGDEALNSLIPEKKGADILLYTSVGVFGWQRKRIPSDFISSVTDGRFARLLPALTKGCVHSELILEGKFKYWPDGTVFIGKTAAGKKIPCRFNRRHIHGILNDIEFVWNVPVRCTEDEEDTVMYLRSVRDFLTAKKHVGLFTRPKVKGLWAVPTADEFQSWILQGFPGIGVNTAEKILNYFGGIPLCWTVSPDELRRACGLTVNEANEVINILKHAKEVHVEPGTRKLTPTIIERGDVISSIHDMKRRLG